MLEELKGKISKIDSFLESSGHSPNIVLYGAGYAMPAILRKLERNGFCVVAICDSDPNKHGHRFDGTYPIMSVEGAKVQFPDARFVISSTKYFAEILALLTDALNPDRVCDVDLWCAHYFEKGEFAAFFNSEFERFANVYDRLEDDESRETYFKVIKAHTSGERKDFEDAFTGDDDWYLFQSLLKPVKETSYVDCGAYDGDTIRLFLDAADEGYRKVFAFEPDPLMLHDLQALSDTQNGKMTIIRKGVSDEDGTIVFRADGVFSKIVDSDADADVDADESLMTISVAKLDSALGEEKVSMIKMDIEGAEFDALQGAATLIEKHKPKLAICLYHKVEDFVRIAELILQLVPEYKIRLKHQSQTCTDTILFATLD